MHRPLVAITGPTSGIGAGFAGRYAAAGYDLLLIARDVDRLHKLAADLREAHETESEVLAADLSDAADRVKVAERVARGVRVLINNAGFGIPGDSWNEEPALLQAQLDVNVTAVMQLTRAALPAMVAAGEGTVINVASVAGLLPGRAATYAASKAWVISFSEGLARELTGTGVTVHALCPGFVHTEFHQRAGLDMSKLPGAMWLDVDEVVDGCLSDITKGKVIIIPGMQYKLLTATGRMVPRNVLQKLASRVGGGRGRT
jgi:short-subunit dehydrogenase